MLKEVEVWVPHRISGFFQMMDPAKSTNDLPPTAIGSRGGGPALTAFGKTNILIDTTQQADTENFYKIFINEVDATARAFTSIDVLRQMTSFIPKKHMLIIHHTFDLPMGSGYGSSGAGALGIAFGLNILFNLGLPALEVAKFAHIAEVINHTGLGTVGGQYTGGLSISSNPGFPFQMDHIVYPPNVAIVVGSFGAISTKAILTDPVYKRVIHEAGTKGMEKIRLNYSLETFLQVCTQFYADTDFFVRLKLTEVRDLIQALEKMDIYGAGMNQLGRSVFCFCDKSKVAEVKSVFQSFTALQILKVLEICPHGPLIQKII